MDLLEPVRWQLATTGRRRLLASLAHHLTITARNAYPEAGATPDQTITKLRCHNELLHVILGQLVADLGHTPAYPDDVFLSILAKKANRNGCSAELDWALHHASNQTADTSD